VIGGYPFFAMAALALLVERIVGYPATLQSAIGHPVEWMGRLIDWLDRDLNQPEADETEARLRGCMALGVLLAACFVPAFLLSRLLAHIPYGQFLGALVATVFVAQSSLRGHVAAVSAGLNHSLDDGRNAVAAIVGRDPRDLDESGVTRAALESLAENTADGVVSPILWYVFLGLPGLVLYKAINTADSMIGHRSDRYLHFGRAAARLDDLVNLPASRLTGLLLAVAAWKDFFVVWSAMRRDAPRHHSPNAGWPEAAMAAALGLRFGGPRDYDGEEMDLAWFGDGRADLSRTDIEAGLRLYERSLNLLFVLMLAGAVLT
jgi:adenosylcobinamide-phosphate synthase